MNRNTLGELKLSPLKENGKFIFINNEVRVNGKLNKGDYIKIYVESYEVQNGRYVIKNARASSKIVVRGMALQHDFSSYSTSVDDLYNEIGTMYKNQFYFGRIAI